MRIFIYANNALLYSWTPFRVSCTLTSAEMLHEPISLDSGPFEEQAQLQLASNTCLETKKSLHTGLPRTGSKIREMEDVHRKSRV
jgi:hypothetical protein